MRLALFAGLAVLSLTAAAAAPDLRPATGLELTRMISGRAIKKVDERIAGVGPENLCPDGQWTQQIERVRRWGRWRVEDGRLCLQVGGEERCREALIDGRGELWLAPAGLPGEAKSYTIWPRTAELCTGIGAP